MVREEHLVFQIYFRSQDITIMIFEANEKGRKFIAHNYFLSENILNGTFDGFYLMDTKDLIPNNIKKIIIKLVKLHHSVFG